jgi:hypothetical protein
LSDWLHERLGRQHGIALIELAELLFTFLTKEKNLPAPDIAAALWKDYQAGGRRDVPKFLRPHLADAAVPRRGNALFNAPKRQQRHLAARFGERAG